MLNHLLRLALAVMICLLTFYTAYALLSPHNEHLAALVAYGLLFTTPLPLILTFYGKAKLVNSIVSLSPEISMVMIGSLFGDASLFMRKIIVLLHS